MAQMADCFELKIISPEKTEYEGMVSMVSIPAVTGLMTVLPNHAPVLALLDSEDVIVYEGNNTKNFRVSGGFMEFSNERMLILTDDRLETEN